MFFFFFNIYLFCFPTANAVVGPEELGGTRRRGESDEFLQ